MSLAQALSTYTTLQFLLLITFVLISLYTWIAVRARKPLSGKLELRLHYFLLSLIFVIAAVQPFFPKKTFFEPAAKVWSAQSIKEFPNQYTAPDKGGYLSVPTATGTNIYDADQISWTLLTIALLVSLFGGLFIARDLFRLMKIKQGSHLIRKLGQVHVFSNPDITVPFSYWTPNRSNIIVPQSILETPQDFKIAVVHELQHHRQRDTIWVYVVWFFRIFCMINPIIHLWAKKLAEVQEFACDEALVDQNKVESRQYAGCLLRVAESAFNQKYVPACATGLMFLVERKLLTRRIVRMTTKTKSRTGSKITSGIFGMLSVALITATAFASQGVVQDHRISLETANQLAANIKASSGIPIEVNDLVLTQLNRYIGTPEGREFMKGALKRMLDHKTLIQTKIQKYKVPSELIAIPIAESGYQNLPESDKGNSAGLWMFIKSTARKYGMRVDEKVDERLDISLETDAAMRYFRSNHLIFNDWLLSILAYNMGENAVARAIEKTGSRDAWTLIRKGHEGDKNYLPKVIASIIIMNNPTILN